MVKKFHINPDGRVMECGAKIKCDFADSPHFDDFSSASNYAELMAMKSWKESKSETNERKPPRKVSSEKKGIELRGGAHINNEDSKAKVYSKVDEAIRTGESVELLHPAPRNSDGGIVKKLAHSVDINEEDGKSQYAINFRGSSGHLVGVRRVDRNSAIKIKDGVYVVPERSHKSFKMSAGLDEVDQRDRLFVNHNFTPVDPAESLVDENGRASREVLSGKDFSGSIFMAIRNTGGAPYYQESPAVIKNSIVSNSSFNNVDMADVDIKNTKFEGCDFTNTEFGMYVRDSEFVNCKVNYPTRKRLEGMGNIFRDSPTEK